MSRNNVKVNNKKQKINYIKETILKTHKNTPIHYHKLLCLKIKDINEIILIKLEIIT